VLLAGILYSNFGAVGFLGDNFIDFLEDVVGLVRRRVATVYNSKL
jgi:hypothetical protein